MKLILSHLLRTMDYSWINNPVQTVSFSPDTKDTKVFLLSLNFETLTKTITAKQLWTFDQHCLGVPLVKVHKRGVYGQHNNNIAGEQIII